MTNKFTIRVPEDRDGLYERIQYPAAELQVRLRTETLERIEKADKIQVICQMAHVNLMELCLAVNAITRAAEHRVIQLLLPYLPYARADRRFVAGDCFGLETFGSILNTLLVDDVITLDVHSLKAHRLVNRLRNVEVGPFIDRAYADVYNRGLGSPTVLLPDEGSLERYNLAPYPYVKHATKIRDGATGHLSGFKVPNIATTNVLIVDDICDGGGTFIGIAEKLPRDVKKYLYVTHGIFSKGLRELQGHFERIYTTDSFNHGYQDKFVTCYDALELLND